MFARAGDVHCYNCGEEIRQQTVDEIVDKIMAMPVGSKVMIISPVIRGKKGEYVKLFEDFKKSGYSRMRVDGVIYSLDEEIKLDKNSKHDISVVVDRLVIEPDIQQRLTDSVETAIKLSDGMVVVFADDKETMYNTKYTCGNCGISISEVEPRLFSFNSPWGACPTCGGLGYLPKVEDINLDGAGVPTDTLADGSRKQRATACGGRSADSLTRNPVRTAAENA